MKIRIRYRTLDNALNDKHRIQPKAPTYRFAQYERRSFRGRTIYLVNDLKTERTK